MNNILKTVVFTILAAMASMSLYAQPFQAGLENDPQTVILMLFSGASCQQHRHNQENKH